LKTLTGAANEALKLMAFRWNGSLSVINLATVDEVDERWN